MQTAGITAVWNEQEWAVQLLLEHGANANEGGEYGTRLQAALWKWQEKVAQLLIQHGANIGPPSAQHRTHSESHQPSSRFRSRQCTSPSLSCAFYKEAIQNRPLVLSSKALQTPPLSDF